MTTLEPGLPGPEGSGAPSLLEIPWPHHWASCLFMHPHTGPWWGLDTGMVLAPGGKVKLRSGGQAGPRCEHATGLSLSPSDSCLLLGILHSPSAGKGTRPRSVAKYLLQDSSGDLRLTFQRACPGITPDRPFLSPPWGVPLRQT